VVIMAIAASGIWYERFRRSDDAVPVAGVVRATEIHISPKVSGRLARVLVEPVQSVQRGEPLALLGNPELWAAVAEARAQVDKAASDRDRAFAGVRQEEVETLRREILKAQTVLVYARQDLDRKSALAARSDVSLRERHEARAETAHAEADVAVAEARYAEAQLGPTAEERALADAQVKAAEVARDVVEARAAKTLLRAPASGVVGSIGSFGADVRHADRNSRRGEFAAWRAARASGDPTICARAFCVSIRWRRRRTLASGRRSGCAPRVERSRALHDLAG
jgi:HlyD family secretion protein